jgi:small subunit ribosomal protein S4
MIGDRKIDIPSYIVTVEEEGGIHFTPESKIPEMLEKSKAKDEAEKPTEATEKPTEATEKPTEATEKPTEAKKDKDSSTK